MLCRSNYECTLEYTSSMQCLKTRPERLYKRSYEAKSVRILEAGFRAIRGQMMYGLLGMRVSVDISDTNVRHLSAIPLFTDNCPSYANSLH